MNHPEIHVKDWIDVGNRECVVQRLLPPGSPVGACIVVLNKTKPTTRIAGWNGEKWYFMSSHDFGGYADEYDPCVRELNRGRR
ncbi:hypothetical protein QFM71_003795 [Escherichia coli]|nr:hypothetical protein [Escherichia coli]MDF6209435.1 hypothetical protein [Escherichia coli]HCD4201264.1 hypothetical protein [Escherichia coli]HCL6686017.1 hypothetical protein [Escherichia coli]HEA0892686.1 hypothetical protein [Escherichia coli]